MVRNKINVARNWTNNGVFNAGNSEVILDTTGLSVVTGNSTFNDLTSSTGGKHILFGSGNSQDVGGMLSLNGGNGQKLLISGTGSGGKWNIHISEYNVDNVVVNGSNNSGKTVYSETSSFSNSKGWKRYTETQEVDIIDSARTEEPKKVLSLLDQREAKPGTLREGLLRYRYLDFAEQLINLSNHEKFLYNENIDHVELDTVIHNEIISGSDTPDQNKA